MVGYGYNRGTWCPFGKVRQNPFGPKVPKHQTGDGGETRVGQVSELSRGHSTLSPLVRRDTPSPSCDQPFPGVAEVHGWQEY